MKNNSLIYLYILILGGLLVFSLGKPSVIAVSQRFLPSPTPKYLPTPTPADLDADKLLNLINEYRSTNGLKPFIKDERLCAIAKDRVENFPHLDNHEGLYKKYSSLPYVISENLVESPTEGGALAGWISSPPHKKAMLSPAKYTCVYCKGDYCSEIFSSFKPYKNDPY